MASSLAGIEYHGIPGGSKDCQDAVMRLLQFGTQIQQARIVSCSRDHCFLLKTVIGDLIAIKSGFASGYGGEGPRRFSYALQFLKEHAVEIDECEVSKEIIERLDRSALTNSDIRKISAAKAVRPSRWYDYVRDDGDASREARNWQEFPPIIPYSVIDPRIMDLALSFWSNPDDRLLKGYRRLEDIVRKRTGIDEHGSRLFSKAFIGTEYMLEWKNIDEGERAGRANLFSAAYMAHRNPRAHRELEPDSSEQLSEFLLLNHLYRMESETQLVTSGAATQKDAKAGSASRKTAKSTTQRAG